MEQAPASSGYAPVGTARLYYETFGAGPTVVLLHAGIADRRMWDPQIFALAARFQVIRYDLRGYGLTRAGTEPFSPADDLLGLLRYLGIERAHLVGLSLGGSVALDAALTHLEAVASLVLASTVPSGFPRSERTQRGWAEGDAALERGDRDRAIEIDLEMWAYGPRRSADAFPAATRAWLRELVAGTYAVPEVGSQTPLEPPAARRLGEVQAPTLVFVGDADQPEMLPASELLERGIPNARRVVFPGVAHLINVERPDEFNRLVTEFIEQIAT